MSDSDADAAISAALSLDWQKASSINEKILASCPDDIDCLNRLGKAYLELGASQKAIACFKKVLKINKYDPIASKNLARVAALPARKKSSSDKSDGQSHRLISFLEEPGKTKVVNLVNTAPVKTLLLLNNADPVILLAKKHAIFVTNSAGSYLGALPDDIGHRLLILVKGGNKYEGYVKSLSKNSLTIFVKETVRAKKFHNTPSFPASSADYLSFVREESSGEEPQATAETAEADQEEATFTPGEKIHQDEESDE